MCNHRNSLSVAAVDEKKYEARVRRLANDLDELIRNALPRTLQRLKGDDLRKPYPEPRQLFSDTLRGHAHPAHSFGDFMGRMIADGMTHSDARFFAAKFVQWVDNHYAEQLPSLSELGPQLCKESGEALSALMIASRDPSTPNLERALDETREAEVLAAITNSRLTRDRNQRIELRQTAFVRVTNR